MQELKQEDGQFHNPFQTSSCPLITGSLHAAITEQAWEWLKPLRTLHTHGWQNLSFSQECTTIFDNSSFSLVETHQHFLSHTRKMQAWVGVIKEMDFPSQNNSISLPHLPHTGSNFLLFWCGPLTVSCSLGIYCHFFDYQNKVWKVKKKKKLPTEWCWENSERELKVLLQELTFNLSDICKAGGMIHTNVMLGTTTYNLFSKSRNGDHMALHAKNVTVCFWVTDNWKLRLKK